MKTCWVPSDWDGAAHYRCFYPAAHLAELGHPAVVPPVTQHGATFVFERIDETLPAADADVYVFHHPTGPDYHRIRDVLPGRLVVDLDDDFRHLPRWHPAFHLAEGKPDGKQRHVHWVEKTLEVADLVTVATDSLADSYADYGPVVLRNRLHWRLWQHVTPAYQQAWRRVRVGWMGGVEWRKADLDVLRGVIGPWLQDHPDVEFVAAGDQRVHDLLGVPKGQRVTTARVPFRNNDLPYTTATMDVGLVPLARNKFNESKSYLKGLEYAACGIPCIATPTHEYKLWVQNGVNGLLAAKPAEWRAALDELVADTELRHRMGRAARLKAQANSYDLHIHEWEAAYRDLCNRDHPDRARPETHAGRSQSVSESADRPGQASRPGGHKILWAADHP